MLTSRNQTPNISIVEWAYLRGIISEDSFPLFHILLKHAFSICSLVLGISKLQPITLVEDFLISFKMQKKKKEISVNNNTLNYQ